MPGVTQLETVSPTNPLLFFAYQTNGFLTDVYELKFSVRRVSDDVTVLTEVTLNLSTAKIGTGRYAHTFTTTPASTWTFGTYEAIWKYKAVATDPEHQYRQRFEILDPKEFASGKFYVGYADSNALATASAFSGASTQQIQTLIASTSRYIELITGRFFEPRYLTSAYSSRGGSSFPLEIPLIGVDSVFELGTGPADQLFQIDNTSLRVFNRHLEGLLTPDDRDAPRIEFVTDILPGRILAQGTFDTGSKNVEIRGVFGYTDPDGTPSGRVPSILARAVGILATREKSDPFAVSIATSSPGRVKMARTRDQTIAFDTSGGAGSVGAGAITGDRTIDDFLIMLMRPPMMGAV